VVHDSLQDYQFEPRGLPEYHALVVHDSLQDAAQNTICRREHSTHCRRQYDPDGGC
jgi:hypothetical protein